MHYVVDGYNLLFRFYSGLNLLEQQRDQVIADLHVMVTALHINLTLVFDSAGTPDLSSRHYLGTLEIIYTDFGESADTLIINTLWRCEKRQCEIIVTSDKRLAEHSRRLGAKTMSVEHFHSWLLARYKRQCGKRQKPPTRPVTRRSQPPASHPSPSTLPKPDDYLQIFEQRLKESEDQRVPTIKTGPVKRRPEPQATKEAPESDYDRWLRLFEERTDQQ